MRPFEIALALASALYLVVSPRWSVARTVAGLAVLPITAIHLTVEGWRWQMVPLYLAATIFFAVAAWEMLSPAARTEKPSMAGRLLGILGLGAVAALPAVVPIWELPQPTGPYAIGTIETVISSETIDPYDPDSRSRKLVLQVWYPADPAEVAAPEPWLARSDIVGPAIAEAFGFPTFALNHSDLIESHSYRQAAVAGSERYPTVVYSHGWTGLRSAALDQIEELASHGFVVVAANHTYGAAATAFPDDELVKYEPSALPEYGTVPDEEYNEAAFLLVATYASDLALIMDELERLDRDGGWLISGRMDLDRIGLFGHSTGGGAVVSVCATDERCDAAVGLDPWVEPVPLDILESGLEVPFLALRSEEWLDYDNEPILRAFARRSSRADLIGIMGAGHQDFTVLPRLSTISAVLDVKGSIDSDRASEIVNAYLVTFFDEHLRGGTGVSTVPAFPETCVGTCS